jgi:hypothetical protein
MTCGRRRNAEPAQFLGVVATKVDALLDRQEVAVDLARKAAAEQNPARRRLINRQLTPKSRPCHQRRPRRRLSQAGPPPRRRRASKSGKTAVFACVKSSLVPARKASMMLLAPTDHERVIVAVADGEAFGERQSRDGAGIVIDFPAWESRKTGDSPSAYDHGFRLIRRRMGRPVRLGLIRQR